MRKHFFSENKHKSSSRHDVVHCASARCALAQINTDLITIIFHLICVVLPKMMWEGLLKTWRKHKQYENFILRR